MHSRFKNRSPDAVAHLRSSKSFRLSFSCTNSHSHAFQGFLFFIAMWCWHVHRDFVFFLKWERREPLHFGLRSKLWIITPHEPTLFLLYSLLKIRHYFARYFSPCMQFCHINVHLKGTRLGSSSSAITRDSCSKTEFNWMWRI